MPLTPQLEQDKICSVQLAIEETGAQWTADKTQFSHLTTKEKHAISGARVGPLVPGIPIVSAPIGIQADADYPAKFDWRAYDCHDWMTPVRTQGNCGCCWAFSTVDTLEAVYNIYTGNPNLDMNMSEQYLVSECCDAGDCGGGWPDWAFEHIRHNGICTEVCYPYIAQNSPCNPCYNWEDNAVKITGFAYVNPTRESFKWALMEYGPMSVVMQNPEDWFLYTAGVYSPTEVVSPAAVFDHCVVLVGWDNDLDAWIIKNNKGTSFGYDGYGYIKFGVLEEKNYAYAITGIPGYGETWIKPVSATASSSREGYRPENTIDGLLNTCWEPYYNVYDATLMFDMGSSVEIDSVLLRPYIEISMFGTALVDIDISVDGVNWTEEVRGSEIPYGYREVRIPISPIPTRYINVTVHTITIIASIYEVDMRLASVLMPIDVTTFNVSPTTCQVPCTPSINIVWTNNSQSSVTFIKGYTLDGVLHDSNTVVLPVGDTTSLTTSVPHISVAGDYEICAYTEVL